MHFRTFVQVTMNMIRVSRRPVVICKLVKVVKTKLKWSENFLGSDLAKPKVIIIVRVIVDSNPDITLISTRAK